MKKKSIEAFESAMLSIIRYFKWLVAAAVVIILLTGVFKVDSNEVAIVLRFGKLVGATTEEQIKEPGLHFAFPYIIDEVIKIPVETVQELTVTTHYSGGVSVKGNVGSTGYAITGDNNIVMMKTVIKYKISDPVRYSLYMSDVQSTVDGITSGETTALIASMNIDSVLTTEKTNISNTLKSNVQEALDAIDCGVLITNVELTTVNPPAQTKEAFDNVTAASVQKQTLIQEANDYTASAIPQAEGEADELIGTAKSNQSSATAKATEEVAEFNGMFEQYKLNPNVVMDGIFRERVSAILAKTGATIIVPDGDDSAKIILP